MSTHGKVLIELFKETFRIRPRVLFIFLVLLLAGVFKFPKILEELYIFLSLAMFLLPVLNEALDAPKRKKPELIGPKKAELRKALVGGSGDLDGDVLEKHSNIPPMHTPINAFSRRLMRISGSALMGLIISIALLVPLYLLLVPVRSALDYYCVAHAIPLPRASDLGKPIPPSVSAFDVNMYYTPSGAVGDIADVEIGDPFAYNPTGKGSHEWNFKYLDDGSLNPSPAKFGGVVWLSPPNEFGTVQNGGYDLRGFKKIQWEACSETGAVVEFFIGGINWIWNSSGSGAKKTPSPYPDSMPRLGLGIKTLTPKWQPFEADIERPEDDLKRVVGGFGWVANWANNQVVPNESGTAPLQSKRITFKLRNIHYKR